MPGFRATRFDIALIVRTGIHRCALRACDVLETMRPLPMEPLGNSPGPVLGLSVIRGTPVPVIGLGRLLGETEWNQDRISRFISLRVGERRIALAVEEVLYPRGLEASSWEELPPLLSHKNKIIDAIGVLDTQLLLLLGTARMIPEEAWEAWEKSEQ